MKYCTTCGKPMEDNDTYCKSCGTAANLHSQQVVPPDFNFTKYMTLSILSIIFSNIISGILALVFTIIANDALKAGDYLKAKTNQGYAKICLIISLILAAVLLVVVILWIIVVFVILNATFSLY